MLLRRFILTFAAGLGCVGFASAVFAEDAPTAEAKAALPAKAAASPAADIPALIKQLDAEDFTARQEASNKLTAAGEQAIEPLAAAALGDSPEVTTRAIEVLREQSRSDDAPLATAARAALEKLTKSEHASAARRAEAALKPEEKPTPQNEPGADPALPPAPFRGGGAVRIHVGGIAIGGGGVGGMRMSVKSTDGNKEIDVEEGGRKVKIEESAAGKIKMSVTEKKDGKETTQSYEAASADDLKKLHPDAHEIYEKYNGGGAIGAIEIRAAEAFPLPPGAIPGGIRIMPAPGGGFAPVPGVIRPIAPVPVPVPAPIDGAEMRKRHAEKLGEAIKRLEQSKADLEKSAADGIAPEAIKESLERLEETRKRLEETKARLEGGE